MSPETFIALLVIAALIGLIALAVTVYLWKRRNEERFDKLNHSIDQLDERTIHENSTLDKKTEEIRRQIRVVEEEIGNKLNQRLSESEETWEKGYAEFKRILENLVQEQRHSREELETGLENRLKEGFSDLEKRTEDQEAILKGYDEQVQRVTMRNELQGAVTYLQSRQPEKALEILRPLLAEDPGNRDAVLLCARACQQCGDLSSGAECLTKALEHFSGDADLLAELARIRGLQGDHAERVRLVAEGLVRSPEHARLRFERALSHISHKNYEGARSDLETVISQGVQSPEVYYNLGIVETHLGNIPSAIQHLRKSISLDPVSADGNHALGLTLMAAESYVEAVDFLTRARNLKPENVRSRLDLAAALRLSGSPEAAIKECQVARKLDDRVPRTELEEALARHDLAEFREALEILDNLLQWQPAYKNARRLKAEILMETERIEEAVMEWSKLAEHAPDDAEIKVELAEAVKRNGQPEAALGWFEVAARMAPGIPWIQVRFAKEALALQKFERVREALETSEQLATSPESRLQFIEIRLLLILKDGRFGQLDRLLRELQAILRDFPEVVPLDKKLELHGEELMGLGLNREATKIHTGLTDLYDGAIDFETFDDIVTQVMRSLLPPAPAPKPAAQPASAGNDGRQPPEETHEQEENAPEPLVEAEVENTPEPPVDRVEEEPVTEVASDSLDFADAEGVSPAPVAVAEVELNAPIAEAEQGGGGGEEFVDTMEAEAVESASESEAPSEGEVEGESAEEEALSDATEEAADETEETSSSTLEESEGKPAKKPARKRKSKKRSQS